MIAPLPLIWKSSWDRIDDFEEALPLRAVSFAPLLEQRVLNKLCVTPTPKSTRITQRYTFVIQSAGITLTGSLIIYITSPVPFSMTNCIHPIFPILLWSVPPQPRILKNVFSTWKPNFGNEITASAISKALLSESKACPWRAGKISTRSITRISKASSPTHFSTSLHPSHNYSTKNHRSKPR